MRQPISTLQDEIVVVLVDIYTDGTIWFSFQDSKEQYATLCIDGRKGSPTRFRMFDQARHPSEDSANLIALGSPEEGVVIPLISWWVSSEQSNGCHLTEYGFELFLETFDRYGEPYLLERSG